MLSNYFLIIKFGDVVVPVNNTTLHELTITQDLNKFLPEFKLRVSDYSGILTHVLPFDKKMSNVYIEVSEDKDSENKNCFNFIVYRRSPEGDQSNPSSVYSISGLLDINNLFSKDYSRGFSGSIKTNLEEIAISELGVDSTEVSSSLNTSKNLIQPNWNNSQFLKFLTQNLIGCNSEYAFKCFIKMYKMKKVFCFSSIKEMVDQQVSYKFIVKDTQYEDRLPIFNYSIFDNYKMNGVFASKKQGYSYFDYDTSTFIENQEEVSNYLSLSDYYMIDKSDSDDSNTLNETGRSNDFNDKFQGQIKSSYANRLIGLAKMWVTTNGMPNICPGNIIEIFFPHGVASDNLYSYQYSGYWLVERVVHNFGDTFLTKLLLTRHGVDTDKSTTLLRASTKKQA